MRIRRRAFPTRIVDFLAALWLSALVCPFFAADMRPADRHPSVAPESVRFEHLTTDQGLSSNIICAIFQDRSGYLWIGTDTGLDLYDGYTVTTFRHDPNDPRSLPGYHVQAICEDASGTLWVGTFQGLGAFDRRTRTFTCYRNEPDNPRSLSHNVVHSLCLDRQGVLWVGTKAGGLNRFDPDRREFVRYESNPANPTALTNMFVSSLCADRDGNLWVGTADGLNWLGPDRKEVKRRFPLPDGGGVGWVRSIFEDRSGTIWLGCDRPNFESVFFRFDKTTWMFHPVLSTDWSKTSLHFSGPVCEDDRGRLWIGTLGGGVYIHEPATGATTAAGQDLARVGGLGSNFVTALCRDRTGVIWIGTEVGGVNKYARLKEKFTLYRSDAATPNRLGNNMVRGICKDRSGVLWIATQGGGLNRHDRQTNTWTVFRHDPNRLDRISSDSLLGIFEDRDGFLWIGTEAAGINRFDPRTGRCTQFKADPNNPHSLSHNPATCVTQDRDGTLWIGTDGGINALDPTTGRFTRYSGLPLINEPSIDVSLAVQALHIDRDGLLWVAAADWGLLVFDTKARRYVRRYFHDPNDPTGLSHNFVTSMAEDASGNLWITTKGGGLNRFDRERGTFVQIRKGSAPMPDRNTYGVLADDDDNLWISCDNGLARYTPSSGKFRFFTTADGLQGSEFNRFSSFKSRDGELFFGGVDGFNSFRPRDLAENGVAPPVVVTAFKKFNETAALAPSLDDSTEIDLPHSDNFLSFEFAALDFTSPESNRYRYKLEGADRDWTEVDAKRRFVNYTHLSFGDYVFRVQASNNDGVWNERGAALRIRINPPWWRRWWMYAVYVLGGTGLAFSGVAYRTRTWRRRNERLERMVRERTAELDRKNEELAEQIEQSRRSETAALEAREEAVRAERSALEAREDAVRANRAKSAFLAGMSHELRTPLNAVLGFVQVMQREPGRNAKDREHLDIILRSGEHLLGLMNNVLSISKIEAGNVSLNETEFDLIRFFQGLQEMFHLRARGKGLTLSFELSSDLPNFVWGDEGKLRQICINLLGNAVKFTETGYVVLHAAWGDDRLRCEVEDTGCGIAEEELGGLFQPFVQTESGRKSLEGTGLGLALSRDFARLMEGDITVRSMPGKGSVFGFEIKLGAVSKTESELPALKVVGIQPGQPVHRILVADDNPENRRVLRELLEPFGFEILEANDGLEAVECWRDRGPRLIFMDLRMPRMDGHEAIKRIRALERDRVLKAALEPCDGQFPIPEFVKIVVVSASVFDHEREAVLESGCEGFLGKPFREIEVFNALADHLGVRFVYDYAEPEPKTPPEETASALTPERLAKFPPEWVEKLDQALNLGDLMVASALIEEIRDLDESAADELATLVREFRFDAIQDALAKTEIGVRGSGSSKR